MAEGIGKADECWLMIYNFNFHNFSITWFTIGWGRREREKKNVNMKKCVFSLAYVHAKKGNSNWLLDN